MTHEEILKQIPVSSFEDIELGELHDIIKPHPYCITPKHVTYAADHHNGLLGEDAIREAEKYGKVVCDTCRYWNKKEYKPILNYDDHKKEATIIFVLVRAKGRKPSEIPHLIEYLNLIQPKLKELGIKGISLVNKEDKTT